MAGNNGNNSGGNGSCLLYILGIVTIICFADGMIPVGILCVTIWIIILCCAVNASKKEKAERERTAKEKAEQERKAKEKAEQERKAKEKAEQERIATEKAYAEKRARQVEEENRKAKEKAEQERKLKEEQERQEKEKQELYAKMAAITAAVKKEQEQKAAQETDTDSKQLFCINCGKPMPEEAMFCIYCGAKRYVMPENDEKSVKADNNEVVFEEEKCPVCGCKVEVTDSVCKKCGFPVISLVAGMNQEEVDKVKEAVREYRKTVSR